MWPRVFYFTVGTGRSKPYIDKKHFFQELKNPPKKALNDLVSNNQQTNNNQNNQDQPNVFTTNFNLSQQKLHHMLIIQIYSQMIHSVKILL